jgi:2,3-bisphosphoglycerate-independent phosphoglycerate mutase
VYEEILPYLINKNDSKAILLVADGVGGIPVNGRTELEAARTPNLDALAAKSSLGLQYPVGYGITPGSGPGHLSLFGYDPLKYQIGRGILEALGSGMEVVCGDLAVRGNFATMENGLITDRRAGRISTEKCAELVAKIRENISDIDGVKFDIKAARDYRFAVVFHDSSLKDNIEDADPQNIGKPPAPAKSRDKASEEGARIVNLFIDKVTEVLANERPANTCLIRGAANCPDITLFEEKYGMRAQGIAVYPMYRGLARLVGMTVPTDIEDIDAEISKLKTTWDDFDFHFVHFKYTDSAGEDGDFDKKVAMIEKLDEHIPEFLAMNPDCLVITGDHSTPPPMKLHSWHPVPVLLNAKTAFQDEGNRFTEKQCSRGILGHIPGTAIMLYTLANCGRLLKFGA